MKLAIAINCDSEVGAARAVCRVPDALRSIDVDVVMLVHQLAVEKPFGSCVGLPKIHTALCQPTSTGVTSVPRLLARDDCQIFFALEFIASRALRP